MLDVRGGRDVGDGTETGFVGEDSSLQTGEDDGTDSSSDDRLCVERIFEDHLDGHGDLAEVHADYDECECDPCECHEGDDGGGELSDLLDSPEEHDRRSGCDDGTEHDIVVLELECLSECRAAVRCLDSDESDTECEDGECCKKDTEVPALESLACVVCGTSVVSAVGLLLFVELCQNGLHEAACGTDDREDPHPEDRSGSSGYDRCGNSCDVTYTDTCTHSDTECFERRYFDLVIISLDIGQCQLGRLVDLQDLHELQPVCEVQTQTDEEYERYVPDVLVSRVEYVRQYLSDICHVSFTC